MPQIAGYELYSIETGRFALDGGAMFGIVPRVMWERNLMPDAKNRVPMALRCLLLVGNDRVILVDDGAGDKYDAKFASLFAIDQTHSELRRSLAALGLVPEDVTDVILSHLHFDHAGGSTTRKGDLIVPSFANAQYHVQRKHWDWAQKPNARERNSFLKENLQPLAESGQLNLVDGDGVLFEGVSLHTVNGHTQGMHMVKVSDAQQTLVFTADLLPTQFHVPSVWVMAYDLEPLVSMAEKEAFFQEAIAGNWAVIYDHDVTCEISNIQQTARGFIATNQRSLAEL